VKYEFVLYGDSSAALTLDGEVMWSSDNDEEFLAEFDEVITSDEIDGVIDWLEGEGYIPPGVEVDIVDYSGEDDDEDDDDELDDEDDEDGND
jgi:hypothetical protein